MDKVYLVPSFIIIILLCLIVILFLGVIFFYLYFKKDILIFIDETNRFHLIFRNIKDDKIKINNKIYYLYNECGLINKNGKKLFIFSENNPSPAKISYKKLSWLDSKNLNLLINNDIIQNLLSPSQSLKIFIIIILCICGLNFLMLLFLFKKLNII